MNIGCGDTGCIFRHPDDKPEQETNTGCRCILKYPTHEHIIKLRRDIAILVSRHRQARYTLRDMNSNLVDKDCRWKG